MNLLKMDYLRPQGEGGGGGGGEKTCEIILKDLIEMNKMLKTE